MPWLNLGTIRYYEDMKTGLADYDVTTIPTNYLFDAQGRLIGKDLRGEDLIRKLKELLD